ncbi:hypothetical protein VTN96DRAFT_2348 [Rasamsonia emersonii]
MSDLDPSKVKKVLENKVTRCEGPFRNKPGSDDLGNSPINANVLGPGVNGTFNLTEPLRIETSNLCGGSAAVVAMEDAAILCHISPQEDKDGIWNQLSKSWIGTLNEEPQGDKWFNEQLPDGNKRVVHEKHAARVVENILEIWPRVKIQYGHYLVPSRWDNYDGFGIVKVAPRGGGMPQVRVITKRQERYYIYEYRV